MSPIKVLFHAHPKSDTLDLIGALQVFDQPVIPSTTSKAFQSHLTSSTEYITTDQGLVIKQHISLSDAYSQLSTYDILVIPGGDTDALRASKSTEPTALIQAFAALPKKADGTVRTILTVCTGSLLVAEAGLFKEGASIITTHPEWSDKLRKIVEGTDAKVVGDRFVVNTVDEAKGLRIITGGGVSSGIDAALWIVEDLFGKEQKERAAYIIQYEYKHGLIL